MFSFLRDLCGRSDEEKLNRAIKQTPLIFKSAITSSAFSYESNQIMGVGTYLIEQLNDLLIDELDVGEKIKKHDLIVVAIIALTLIQNFFNYQDPLVPFKLTDLEEGLECTLSGAMSKCRHDISEADKKLVLEYICGIGEKILVEKKFPILEFDGPSGGSVHFHYPVNSMLIKPYPDIERHACLMLFEKPGQKFDLPYMGFGGVPGQLTLLQRIELREQKRQAIANEKVLNPTFKSS